MDLTEEGFPILRKMNVNFNHGMEELSVKDLLKTQKELVDNFNSSIKAGLKSQMPFSDVSKIWKYN